MKTIKITLLMSVIGLVSLPAAANPCIYMAPVVYAGAVSGYYQGLELNASLCFKNEYDSSACRQIKDVYHVDLDAYFNDASYHRYINNLSHEPIQNASNMAIKNVKLMLSELEGQVHDVALEEAENLAKLGRKVTQKELSKSLTRFKGVGLCQ